MQFQAIRLLLTQKIIWFYYKLSNIIRWCGHQRKQFAHVGIRTDHKPIRFTAHIRKLILFILCIGFSFNTWAQKQALVDSLTQQLDQRIPTQTRVDIYNELAWQYRNTHTDTALYYGVKALALAQPDGYWEGAATAHNRMAIVLRNTTRYDSALWHSHQALTIEEKTDNLYGIGRAKNGIATIYKKQEMYWKAIPFYKEALSIFNHLEKWSAASQVMNNLGVCYSKLGEFEEAIKLFMQTLAYYQKHNQSKQLVDTHLKLSHFYFNTRNGLEVAYHAQKSLELAQSLNLPLYILKSQINLGLALKMQSELTQALPYFKAALALSQEQGDKEREQKLLNHLGDTYRQFQKYPTAIGYFEQCLALAPSAKIKTWALHNLGKAQFKMRQFEEAKVSLDTALELSFESKNLFSRLKILKDLGALHTAQQNFQLANSYNAQYISLSDSLNQSYRSAMHYKDAFEAEQHQKELIEKDRNLQKERIAKFEAESRYQQMWIYSLGVGIACTFLVSFLFVRSYNRKKELEILKRQQERQILGAMFEGQEQERKRIYDDLMGHLGSLITGAQMSFSLMKKNLNDCGIQDITPYQKGSELLQKAGDKIRNISYSIVSVALSRVGLLAALEDLAYSLYNTHQVALKIIQDQFEKERLEAKIELATFRILQDWIEQTVQYARPNVIKIYLSKKPEILNVLVEDDGNGFNLDASDFKNGMGMAHIKGRLNALDGSYVIVKGGIEGKGTAMVFDIPLK